jgi:hypothetical protein
MKNDTKKTGLAKKILAIQSEIQSVAKNGRNDFQNYDYATERDLVSTLKPLLEKHGVIVIPEIAAPPTIEPSGKDGKSRLTTILMKFKLVNVDDPEDYYQALVGGQGQDAGDKGIYKAITGAKKYFISNTFMVPLGDDPEATPQVKAKGGRKKTIAFAEDF